MYANLAAVSLVPHFDAAETHQGLKDLLNAYAKRSGLTGTVTIQPDMATRTVVVWTYVPSVHELRFNMKQADLCVGYFSTQQAFEDAVVTLTSLAS